MWLEEAVIPTPKLFTRMLQETFFRPSLQKSVFATCRHCLQQIPTPATFTNLPIGTYTAIPVTYMYHKASPFPGIVSLNVMSSHVADGIQSLLSLPKRCKSKQLDHVHGGASAQMEVYNIISSTVHIIMPKHRFLDPMSFAISRDQQTVIALEQNFLQTTGNSLYLWYAWITIVNKFEAADFGTLCHR